MDTKVRIKLKPIITTRVPYCDVTVGYVTKMYKLDQEQWVEIQIHPDKGDTVDIIVKHHGKTEEEFKNEFNSGENLAVVVEQIEINGITDPKFVWQGKFYPQYPRWEKDQGPLDTHYLSFNGEWKLSISIPAYTWIHKTLGLGWIYN